MTKKDDQLNQSGAKTIDTTAQGNPSGQGSTMDSGAAGSGRNEIYSVEPPAPTTSMRTLLFSGDEKAAIPSIDKVDGGWSLSVPNGVRMGFEAGAEAKTWVGATVASLEILRL